jgi:hypothetical protein
MLRCAQIASLQRTVSTPSLVDFSRAYPLDLFEQPATRVFQQPAGEFDEFKTMRKPTTVSMKSGGNIVQHAAA